MVLGHTRGPKYTNHRKKFDYIIAIALIRAAKCQKYKILSEVCFGMIFSYFAIDKMEIYDQKVRNRTPKKPI
jgi:hypothetical protein